MTVRDCLCDKKDPPALVEIDLGTQEALGLPPRACTHDINRHCRRYVEAGWTPVYLNATETCGVLRDMGYPVEWMPATIDIGLSLVWEWWADAWAVRVLDAWQDGGRRLYQGSRVHPVLRRALRRGNDLEFRAAVDAVYTLGGAGAVRDFLSVDAAAMAAHKP